jgi:hypothetical protein
MPVPVRDAQDADEGADHRVIRELPTGAPEQLPIHALVVAERSARGVEQRGHTDRRCVLWIHDGTDEWCSQLIEGEGETRSSSLRGVADPAVLMLKVIAQLEQPISLHQLVGQTAVTQEPAFIPVLDDPQPEAVLDVAVEVPSDPLLDSVRLAHVGVETASSLIGEHLRDCSSIIGPVLAEPDPLCRPGQRGWHRGQTYRASSNSCAVRSPIASSIAHSEPSSRGVAARSLRVEVTWSRRRRNPDPSSPRHKREPPHCCGGSRYFCREISAFLPRPRWLVGWLVGCCGGAGS